MLDGGGVLRWYEDRLIIQPIICPAVQQANCLAASTSYFPFVHLIVCLTIPNKYERQVRSLVTLVLFFFLITKKDILL
jgi:hypothetical protein